MASERKQHTEEITTLNQSRAALYRLLSSLYWQELTSEQIERIRCSDVGSLDLGDRDMDDGWADIKSYLAKCNSGTRQELAVDYAHTFLAAGNNDDRMAIPFESVFMSETGLLMQGPRDEVCKVYYDEHVSPMDDLRTPEDHIAFELEFLAVMAERQNEAIEAGDCDEALRIADVQASFHEQHLLNWIDVFCDAIEENCRTPFYQSVAKFTRGWVKLDGSIMNDVGIELRGGCEQALSH